MITYSELVEQMYNKYCDLVGGVAFNGDPLPTWKEFSTDPSKMKQSSAWAAVATFVIRKFEDETKPKPKPQKSFGTYWIKLVKNKPLSHMLYTKKPRCFHSGAVPQKVRVVEVDPGTDES